MRLADWIRNKCPLTGHGKEKWCDKGKDWKGASESPAAACNAAGKAEGLGGAASDGRGRRKDEIHWEE